MHYRWAGEYQNFHIIHCIYIHHLPDYRDQAFFSRFDGLCKLQITRVRQMKRRKILWIHLGVVILNDGEA